MFFLGFILILPPKYPFSFIPNDLYKIRSFHLVQNLQHFSGKNNAKIKRAI